MGRLLGPSEYGTLASLISVLFITSAAGSTLQTTLIKYTSVYYAENNLGMIRTLFFIFTKRVLIFTIIIFILMMIFINNISNFLNIDSTYHIVFLGVIVTISLLSSISRGVLQGLKKFKSLGVLGILEVFLKLFFGVILVYIGFKSGGALFGLMLSALLAYFFIFLPLREVLREKTAGNIYQELNLKKIYRSMLLILVSTILLSLTSYSDIILVKHFFASHETGYYSAAAQIGRIILFFPGAVSIVIFPRFSEKFVKKENLQNTILKSFSIIALTSIIFLVIYFFFPEFIVKLIYGSKYLEASYLIFKYGVFMSFISLITLQILYFISIEKFWYLIYLFIILVGQIALIWNIHSSLEIVIIILIITSTIIFLINLLLMIFYGKVLNKVVIKNG